MALRPRLFAAGGNVLGRPPALVLPRMDPAQPCTHGVTFDEEAARGMTVHEVRKRWPRGWGPCPLGCGWTGIAYASAAHFVMGDW